MYKITLTTQLIAIFTAFAAFTMPIALELLNRVKSKFGSPFYVDTVEKILGFKITGFIKQLFIFILIFTVYSLLSSVAESKLNNINDYFIITEMLFFSWSIMLLYREFTFLRVVYEITKSDFLVEEYIFDQLKNSKANEPIQEEIYDLMNMLIQIAQYNIEFSKVSIQKKTHSKIIKFIDDSCKNNEDNINMDIVAYFLEQFPKIISRSDKCDKEEILTAQHSYAFQLVNYLESKNNNSKNISTTSLYFETSKELSRNEYSLSTADFLVSVSIFLIRKPATIYFIDNYVKTLLDLLIDKKPELVCVLMENYRNIHNFDSYFSDEMHHLMSEYLSKETPYPDNKFEDVKHIIEKFESDFLIERTVEFHEEVLTFLDDIKNSNWFQSANIEETTKLESLIDDIKQEFIKGLGISLAKALGIRAISRLSEKHNWKEILLCLNYFDFSGTDVHMLGTRIYPNSYSEIISSLVNSLSFKHLSSVRKDDLNYIKSIPLLIMQQIYSHKIGDTTPNFDELDKTEIDLSNLTLREVNSCKKKLEKARYYANSEIYAYAFCDFHNLHNETYSIHESSLKTLDSLIENINNKIKYIEEKQPISRHQTKRFEQEFIESELNSLSLMPLLKFYEKSKKESKHKYEYKETFERKDFMEDTGTHFSFKHSYIMKDIHTKLLYNLIVKKGKLIETFIPDELQSGDYLIISSADRNDMSEMTGASLRNYSQNNNFTLLTLPYQSSLGKYYIYREKRDGSLLTLNTNCTSEDINELYRSILNVEFNDVNGSIEVIKSASIELNF
ncbi:hypothetical protein [Vibrio diabolicus]|uniref:hypothetical protein n=1 Tax=Vibrio diabolicus TaxID=50719 RepID=UPI0035A87283